MAGDRGALRRVLRRRRRPRRRAAPSSSSATRSSRSTASRAPTRPSSAPSARHYRRAARRRSAPRCSDCDLLHSFRSAPPILALVDAVFAGAGRRGPRRAASPTTPIAPDRPGRVELWPFLPKPDKPDETPLGRPASTPAPPTTRSRSSPAASPTEIAGWLADRPRPARRRTAPIRPGDVMILVQRRGDLFHAIIRALKRAARPGRRRRPAAHRRRARRQRPRSPRCASPPRPADDLSLAALLRSPLGGLSERELFELAHPRAGTPLARAARRARRPLARGARAPRRPPRPGRLPAARSSSSPASSSATTAAASSSPASAPRPRTASTRCIDQALAYESVEAAEPHRLPRLVRPRRGRRSSAAPRRPPTRSG